MVFAFSRARPTKRSVSQATHPELDRLQGAQGPYRRSHSSLCTQWFNFRHIRYQTGITGVAYTRIVVVLSFNTKAAADTVGTLCFNAK